MPAHENGVRSLRKGIDMPLRKASVAGIQDATNNRPNRHKRLNIVWQYIIGVNENIVHPEPLKMSVVPTETGAGLTLSSTVANTLRAQITNGVMPPGEKLSIEDLRVSLGVSLSPLREALSRLSAEGFVVLANIR